MVRVNGSEGGPARLAWYTVEKDGGYAGDILAAFELFLVSVRQISPTVTWFGFRPVVVLHR